MTTPTPADRAPLPTLGEALTSLGGCSEALSRLIDAVRGLFDSASTQAGYEAAVDWCKEEAARYART